MSTPQNQGLLQEQYRVHTDMGMITLNSGEGKQKPLEGWISEKKKKIEGVV